MPERDQAAPWVDGLTVGEVLQRTALRFPDHDAVVFPELKLRWSWAELDRRVDLAASSLLARGVSPGEHVGIWSMNCPEWVVTQFAVGRIGAVLVNINPAYRLHELEETLRQADVTTLVVGLPFKFSNFVEMISELCPGLRITGRGVAIDQAAEVASAGRGRRSSRVRMAHLVRPGKRSNCSRADDPRPGREGERCLQHPVHVRYVGHAQRGDADAPQRVDERLLHRPARPLHRGRPRLRAGAILPLFRLRPGNHGLFDLRLRACRSGPLV